MDAIIHTTKLRIGYPSDSTQVDGNEFTINVVEPTDNVIAPIVSVY